MNVTLTLSVSLALDAGTAVPQPSRPVPLTPVPARPAYGAFKLCRWGLQRHDKIVRTRRGALAYRCHELTEDYNSLECRRCGTVIWANDP